MAAVLAVFVASLLGVASALPDLTRPAGAAAPSRYTPQASAKNGLNRDRVAHGLPALRTHGQAQRKAQAWAERLAAEGRMYHSRLRDGIGPGWCRLGENVGYASSMARVQELYMRSPSHRHNILNPAWNGVGVGVAYRGKTVYVVHVFIRTC